MQNTLKIFSVFLILFSVLLATSATAQDKGFYINAAVGQSDVDISGFDEGTSFSFGGGYSFNQNFALETSYIDFGDMEDDISPVWTLSGDAITACIVGKVPFTKIFSGFAKVGVFAWDFEVSEAGFGELASDDGTDFTYGLGLMLDFTEKVSSYVQFQRYAFEADGEDVDLDNISLGLQISF